MSLQEKYNSRTAALYRDKVRHTHLILTSLYLTLYRFVPYLRGVVGMKILPLPGIINLPLLNDQPIQHPLCKITVVLRVKPFIIIN